MPIFSQIQVGRVANIPIKLDMSWFIIFALVAWTLAVGFFPTEYPNLPPGAQWLMGVASAVLLFASVLAHELCHSYVARRHGIPIRGVTLFLFGGVAELGHEPSTPGAEFRIAAAGPLASFTISVIVGALAGLFHSAGAHPAVYGVLKYVSIINFALAVFNLIPGFPLDGGRLLRALLWHITGDLRGATRVATAVGSGFGVGFVVLGVIEIIVLGQFVGGLWLMLIGFFLRAAAQSSYRHLLLRRALHGVTVGQVMSPNVVTVPPHLLVSDLVHDYFMRHRFHSFPVLDQDRLVGLVTLHEVKGVPREKWGEVTVGQIMNTMASTLGIRPSDSAVSAWERMAAIGMGRVPVVEHGALVGILSQSDLIRFLNIAFELNPEPDDTDSEE